MPRATRMSYGRPRGAAEWKALRLALEIAFEIPLKSVPKWIRRAGPGNFRVVREGGEVGGGLALHPFGHWFGGRVVPAFGVAAVGILPDRRARGLASFLMAETLREMARRGAGVSTLYPATTPVYRRVGYERAGDQVFHSLPVERIDAREREPLVRPALASDRRAIRALHAASCRGANGPIERSEYFWWRASGHGERGARTWVVDRAGRVEGYFVLEQDKRKTWPGPAYDLWMPDHAFANPAAGRRILSFLATHRSMTGDLSWPGGLSDPILGLLDAPIVDAKRVNRWMLRVVDLAKAVERRGFAPGAAAEVALEVEDDLLDGNRGRWTLRVADGHGRLVRGGSGRVKVEARGLAPLWSGYQSPFDLRAQGRLDGPDADLGRLAAAFSGPTPWMRDGF